MAYDEKLAERIRVALRGRAGIEERRMFGGIAFLLDGRMFCGVVKDELMVRVGRERHDEALQHPFVRPMDFTGRPMRGMVFVGPSALRGRDLDRWVDRGVDGLRESTASRKKGGSGRAPCRAPPAR